MKKILFIILTVLLFSNKYGYSQEIPEGCYQKPEVHNFR